MKDTKIIAITNNKGGIGKTTTTHILGSILKDQGNDVLYVDLDAQKNLSYLLSVEDTEPNLFNVFEKTNDITEIVMETEQGDILPSSQKFEKADGKFLELESEFLLKDALDKIKDYYDYILIDTPPSLGIMTINALTAASHVIIPTESDTLSINGLSNLCEMVSRIQRRINPNLKIAGILITKQNARTIISQNLAQQLKIEAENLNTIVFNTEIRQGIVAKETQNKRMSILEYDKNSSVAKDYINFTKELLLTIEGE